jgi:Fe2+ or Zn2+ uptake regulation protein
MKIADIKQPPVSGTGERGAETGKPGKVAVSGKVLAGSHFPAASIKPPVETHHSSASNKPLAETHPPAVSGKPLAEAHSQTASGKPLVETHHSSASGKPLAETPSPPASVPSEPTVSAQTARLDDVLRSYGFKVSDENRAILQLMSDNGIPLTHENVAKMNQAMKLTHAPDKALFLFNNGIRLTQANAAQLEGFAEGSTRITEQISRLLQAVADLPDTATARQVYQALAKTVLPGGDPGTLAAMPGHAPIVMGSAVLPGNAALAGHTVLSSGTVFPGNDTLPGNNIAPNTHAVLPELPMTNTANNGPMVISEPANMLTNMGNVLTSSLTGSSASLVVRSLAGSPTGSTTDSSTGLGVGSPTGSAADSPTGLGVGSPIGTTADSPTGSLTGSPVGSSSSSPADLPTGSSESPLPNNGQTQAPGAATPSFATSPPTTPNTIPSNPTANEGAANTGAVNTGFEALSPATPSNNASLAEPPATAQEIRPEALETAFIQRTPASTSPAKPVPPRLAFSLTNSTPQDIDRFINTLRESLQEARQILAGNRETPAAARVMQEIQSLANHIDFVCQIKDHLFFQLPLLHNGQESQAAFHIYKNTKKEAAKSGGTSSALIALETAFMGLFETYVQKTGTAVHCQFRLDSSAIEQKVRDNIHKLEALLQNHRFSLSSFSFAKPGKPYTLLDSPTLFDDDFVTQHTENTLPRFDKRA